MPIVIGPHVHFERMSALGSVVVPRAVRIDSHLTAVIRGTARHDHLR